jgi:hypothetical protein
MASSTIIPESKVAKQITLPVPESYDEVLAVIPHRLFGTNVIGPLPEFFLAVIDAYIPTLLGDIQGYCTGGENRDALARGEDAVRCLARRMATLRGLPSSAHELVDPAYASVIEAFAAAHSEEFHPEGDSFADDWKAWKRVA